MPYGKYVRAAKKGYKYGKKAYKFGKQHQGTAKKALALASKVYRQINSEYHHHDVQGQDTTLGPTGAVLNLHTISQGDTDITRSGSSIKPMRLTGKLRCHFNATATYTQQIQFYIVRAKNERGTAPTWSTVFEPAGSMPLINMPKQWDNRFNTKILWSKRVVLNPNNDSGQTIREVRFNIKLYGHIQYTSGASTAENGGLYLFMCNDDGGNLSTVTYFTRLTFIDN